MDKIVVVAVGKDKPGLIAEVTSIISRLGGNIEDMDQVVLQNVFVMSLIIKFFNPKNFGKLEELNRLLVKKGKKIGLKIHVYSLKNLWGKKQIENFNCYFCW